MGEGLVRGVYQGSIEGWNRGTELGGGPLPMIEVAPGFETVSS